MKIVSSLSAASRKVDSLELKAPALYNSRFFEFRPISIPYSHGTNLSIILISFGFVFALAAFVLMTPTNEAASAPRHTSHIRVFLALHLEKMNQRLIVSGLHLGHDVEGRSIFFFVALALNGISYTVAQHVVRSVNYT
jgi:hypothetical protein